MQLYSLYSLSLTPIDMNITRDRGGNRCLVNKPRVTSGVAVGVTPDYVSASAAEVVTTRDLGRVVVVNICGIQVVLYSAH